MLETDRLYCDDCFNVFPEIPDESIDMILCDMPYGVTACKWDSVLDLDELWKQYKRIIKPHGAIVLSATQPFSSRLVMSNPEMFKYEWIWDKVVGSGFQIAKYRPIQRHENVLCFCKTKLNYYPIMTPRDKPVTVKIYSKSKSNPIAHYDGEKRTYDKKYPQSIIEYCKPRGKSYLHPTQKPTDLFEYLIKTYTQPGELVLDNCIGSGTTAIAAIRTGRRWIGIEKDPEYYRIALDRIEKEQKNLK